MKVKEVMHAGVTFVEPTASLKEIATRMRDDDVGAIPVRADGQLLGIVTDRDITCRAAANSEDLSNLTARDVMTENVACCSPEDDIAMAITAMETKKIRRLAVADSQFGTVGMPSLGDLLHGASKKLTGEVLRAVSGHHG